MSEDDNKPQPETPDDADTALQALLGDLSSELPPETELPQPEEPEQTISPPDPVTIPTELAPLPLEPAADSPFRPGMEDSSEPSAVLPPQGPRPRFQPAPRPRRKRWPFAILLLALGAGLLFLFYPRATSVPEEEDFLAELPPELELPPMDGEFLPETEEPTQPAPAEPPANATLPVPEAPPAVVAHAAPPLPSTRAMDSAMIRNLNGNMKDNRVRFRCDLVLYSRENGLSQRLPPFEEAIRAVATNIFYFTVPGKAILPELEQQVLQKAGFLFPDGRLIRVEVRNLELEPVKR